MKLEHLSGFNFDMIYNTYVVVYGELSKYGVFPANPGRGGVQADFLRSDQNEL